MNRTETKPEQKLPKWFNGEHYASGAEVRNRFSGEACYLNRTELSMYDFIMGCALTFEMRGAFAPQDPNMVREFAKARDWFRQNNPSAYMTLLD